MQDIIIQVLHLQMYYPCEEMLNPPHSPSPPTNLRFSLKFLNPSFFQGKGWIDLNPMEGWIRNERGKGKRGRRPSQMRCLCGRLAQFFMKNWRAWRLQVRLLSLPNHLRCWGSHASQSSPVALTTRSTLDPSETH
jgi:hypothetical protein